MHILQLSIFVILIAILVFQSKYLNLDTSNLSSLNASAFFNPPGNAITSYYYSRIYFVIYVSHINYIPDLPVTLGSSLVIGFIEAKVTSIPARLRTSIIATVSISSQPSLTGTNTDLFIKNIIKK